MKTATKKTAGSLRERAAFYKVSHATCAKWKKAGVDLMNPKAVAAYRAGLREDPAGEETSGPAGNGLTAAREKKVRTETVLLENRIAREEGELVAKADVVREGMRLGAHTRAQWMAMPNVFAAALEGLTAAEIRKYCIEYARARCAESEREFGEGLEGVGGAS